MRRLLAFLVLVAAVGSRRRLAAQRGARPARSVAAKPDPRWVFYTRRQDLLHLAVVRRAAPDHDPVRLHPGAVLLPDPRCRRRPGLPPRHRHRDAVRHQAVRRATRRPWSDHGSLGPAYGDNPVLLRTPTGLGPGDRPHPQGLRRRRATGRRRGSCSRAPPTTARPTAATCTSRSAPRAAGSTPRCRPRGCSTWRSVADRARHTVDRMSDRRCWQLPRPPTDACTRSPPSTPSCWWCSTTWRSPSSRGGTTPRRGQRDPDALPPRLRRAAPLPRREPVPHPRGQRLLAQRRHRRCLSRDADPATGHLPRRGLVRRRAGAAWSSSECTFTDVDLTRGDHPRRDVPTSARSTLPLQRLDARGVGVRRLRLPALQLLRRDVRRLQARRLGVRRVHAAADDGDGRPVARRHPARREPRPGSTSPGSTCARPTCRWRDLTGAVLRDARLDGATLRETDLDEGRPARRLAGRRRPAAATLQGHPPRPARRRAPRRAARRGGRALSRRPVRPVTRRRARRRSPVQPRGVTWTFSRRRHDAQ